MNTELRDKVAIVTGGTRGIGYGIAQAFLSEGAKVFICGRQEDKLKVALNSLSANRSASVDGIPADVSRYQDCRKLIEAAVARFGRIDILVNNAGVGHVYKPIDQISPEVWDTTIGTNLSGTFYCCREAVPLMRKAGSGYIFNISSTASIVRFAGGSAYNASKSGLTGLTETLVKDVRYDGIRVSEIVIGSVSTEDRGYESWKLAVEDVVQIIIDLYKFPSRAMVARVELLPSQAPPNR
ncbi:MAG TPA: SDR family NAD(P)-dependent oxidoreductase [Terriglobales bacterium]|nr:SDR family NAD(P)-dependent oxidoreductase [Terriglobales bacterium]